MIRASQVYIQQETRRLLAAIAKARGMSHTVDEVADELLMEVILMKHPELEPFIRDIQVIEEKMVIAIRNL